MEDEAIRTAVEEKGQALELSAEDQPGIRREGTEQASFAGRGKIPFQGWTVPSDLCQCRVISLCCLLALSLFVLSIRFR